MGKERTGAKRTAQKMARGAALWRGALIVYVIAVLLAGWGLEAWQIRKDREATLHASADELTTLAAGLKTQVIAMIHDGVGAAAAAANELNSESSAAFNDAAPATLSRMLTGGEYVRELFIITPRVYASARRGEATSAPRAAPEWAASVLDANAREFAVGPLAMSPSGRLVLAPIMRRVPSRSGERQWAGALFSLEALQDMYAGLPLSHAALGLVTDGGTVVMRTPQEPNGPSVGENVASYPVFERGKQVRDGVYVFEAPHPRTGVARQYAGIRLGDYPLMAIAARDVHDALAPWRARTLQAVQRGAFTTVALLALTAALYVVLSRQYNALRRSAERFRLVTSASNDGIWDWDVRTNRVYYSPRLKEHFGFDRDGDFPPRPATLWERTHPEDVERVRAAIEKHLTERTPFAVECRGRLRNGEYRWFHSRAQAEWDDAGKPIRMAGALSDIHQRKLAEESLQQAQARELAAREEFAQHLLTAQEQERQRIAHELHDSVGQKLSLIRNRALIALQDGDASPNAAQHLAALSELTVDVIGEVRSVAHSLRPAPIEHLGLREALESLLEETSQSSRLQIERQLDDADDALDGDAATHVYRIVQEALNNILKHAQASRCRVLLERDLRSVRLTIEDDGCGFDPRADETRHGLGLASIAERARMLRASFVVRSSPGAGATLCIEAPIAESPDKEPAAADAPLSC